MMTKKAIVVQMIEKRPEGEWFAREKGSRRLMRRLEHKIGVTLPEDYRHLLTFANGGSVNGPQTAINLEDVDGVILQSTDPWYQDNLPDMVIIGDDGGGNVYFLDPHNRLGRGAGSLFLAPMSSIGLQQAVEVAPNLTEAIRRVYAGEDFTRLLYPPVELEETHETDPAKI